MGRCQPNTMIVHLFVMFVLLGLSGFFSASETALFSVRRNDLRRLEQSRGFVHGLILKLRSDPQGLLILREYAPSALRTGVRGPRQTRVVFTVDLTSTDGLFSARKFQINPDDLVMVTESPINDVVTVSSIIGNLFGLFSRASNF